MENHECPAPGCAESVPHDMLACKKHWFMIPKRLRDGLWNAYRKSGAGSQKHREFVTQCIGWLETNVGA